MPDLELSDSSLSVDSRLSEDLSILLLHYMALHNNNTDSGPELLENLHGPTTVDHFCDKIKGIYIGQVTTLFIIYHVCVRQYFDI